MNEGPPAAPARDRYTGTFWDEDGERAWFPASDGSDDLWHASEALIEFVKHDVEMIGDDDLIGTDYKYSVRLTWGAEIDHGDGEIRLRPMKHPEEVNGEVVELVRVGQYWEVTNAA